MENLYFGLTAFQVLTQAAEAGSGYADELLDSAIRKLADIAEKSKVRTAAAREGEAGGASL